MKNPVNALINHEFLMTNGLGGYAFGTLEGPSARKYHGLYTVSLTPPVQRCHMISKIQKRIWLDDEAIVLNHDLRAGTQEIESTCVNFVHKGTIFQTYQQGNLMWHRELAFKYGTNELAIVYEFDVPQDCFLEMEPWFNFRDHHETETPDMSLYQGAFTEDEGVLKVTDGAHEVFIKSHGIFSPNKTYTEESWYPIETRRGYPDLEKHISMGVFRYPLKKGANRVEISINIENLFSSPDSVLKSRKDRYMTLLEKTGFSNASIVKLVQAADDFVVYRQNTGKKTIIAGYPWFTDWGRDTMIALPGLTLVTGRYEEALEMIEGFLSKAYRGIIPNNFPDEGEAPMYNTSDGTLWLFNAVYHYYEHTKDLPGVRNLLPDLISIIKHHIEGTINDIYMDEDGLLNTGNPETQLTWMDVKVEEWVVTPRHGKAVEINALWYNAVKILMALAEATDSKSLIASMDLETLSEKIRIGFNEKFWNEKTGSLYDLIIEGEPVDIPRPNMIFSVGLTFPVLEPSRWASVVSYVEKSFKVPYGLLTLKRNDENFHAHYEGDLLKRDGAYHRGTAWGWLLGPYLEAHYKTFKDRKSILEDLNLAFAHLEEGIHGSFSEIFEGEAPHLQRGCSAQAWSVGELLRIWWLLHH